MKQIVSRSNPKIKEVRALRIAKVRQNARLFLVEGIRHVGEAIEADAKIETIFFDPDRLRSEFGLKLLEDQAAKGVTCIQLSRDVFESLAEKENPQGILAVVHQPTVRLADLNTTNFPWGVALVSPQDPGNIGTILRTIDAVGASGLILLGKSADPFHPSSIRASMGTIFWLPVVQASFHELISWAEENGVHIIGSSSHGDCDYLQARPYTFPCVLLMGSEREGLSNEHRLACQQIVTLPMHGHATSLNLSVAAGILLYAMLPKQHP